MTARRPTLLLPAAALAGLLALSGCGGGGASAAEHEAMGHSMAGMDHGASGSPTDGGGMAGMSMATGDGLTPTLNGYTLTAVKAPQAAAAPGRLSFQITGPAGGAHKEFVLAQTKLMHVYVVRADLTHYQHVHPTLDTATGDWAVDLTLPAPGRYHLLTEFEALRPNHSDIDALKLGADFTVPGHAPATPFAGVFGGWKVDGYDVALTGEPKVGGGELKLRISRDGKGVTDLQSYLDSFAHVTGFRDGDLKAVHVHPKEGPTSDDPEGGPELSLAPMFAEPGTYRLFVEFQTGGALHTLPMDIKVT